MVRLTIVFARGSSPSRQSRRRSGPGLSTCLCETNARSDPTELRGEIAR